MMNQAVRIVSFLLAVFAWASPSPMTATTPLPKAVTAPDSVDRSIVQPVRLEIRLSKRQVTVYQGKNKIKTYSIAVGRPGWETPTGTFKVMEMVKDPAWVHPFKGFVIPGGDPENPLGRRWIGFWTDGKNWVGFHGTPTPESVGKAASHGCVRMLNKDVEELFQKVSLGTVVQVVK
ncbi:L,D-transpeptidase [Phormidesmis priestleyi]